SPVAPGGVVTADSRPWVTGNNATPERSWDTRCRVEAAQPATQFTFVNCGPAGDAELVRWTYTFAPNGGGTDVTETWQVLDSFETFISQAAPGMDVVAYLDGIVEPPSQGMAETLAKLKASAEA